MFRNHLKTSYRNLIRDKSYSVINIIGLAVGMAACLLIFLYITDELSYDKFHTQSDRIYRMYVDGQFGNNSFRSVLTPNPAKEALLDEFSQVESATRLIRRDRIRVEYDDDRLIENNFYYADEDFFKVFSFPLIRGNPEEVLSGPNQVVLTRSIARKYFGEKDPLGEMIRVQGDDLYKVTGICEDVPHNSHFHFNFLASFSSIEASKDSMWINSSVYTYLVLKEGVNPEEFQNQLNLLVEEYVGPQVVEWTGIDLEEFDKSGNSYGLFLQPMEKIYLHSDFNDELQPVSDVSRIWYFSIIAVFILIIACINFMNLATAKYANRAREVGIRKVMGSHRRQLIRQFLTESVIVALLAVVLAVALVELFLPVFNNISQKSMAMHYFNLSHGYILPFLILFGLLVGLVAGAYPAFFLSSFSPLRILKQEVNRGVKGRYLRGILVTIQFIITISLFISTAVIYQQNQYLTNKKLGFEKDKVLVVERAYYLDEKLGDFIKELQSHTSIEAASVSGSLPGKAYGGSTLQVEGRSSEDMVFFATNYVGEDYVDAMGLELTEGRFFTSDFSDNSTTVVINKKAAGQLGFENPIGKYLMLGKNKYTIIGVTNNYHFESLHKQIRPLALLYFDQELYFDSKFYQYMPVKLNTENLNQSIDYIKERWNRFTNNQPFSYFFLDSDYNSLYAAEQRTGKIFTIFSLLAIFIACLGLFGLSAFMAEKKTKEIGIRKVLGAKIINILRVLYKEVFVLLILSTLVAWPFTYYIMSRWLDNFAFRVDMELLPFLISSVLALLIAVVTTGAQALKAALTNPAYTLRDE
ncbi:MAG: ABC transporter permease [Bacteroidales bacterium]|nr:ABC transporter permease [Bacteroidales bacterium]